MNNNSYNEIMTKILNLKEDFMNLIEVEGLGQPASDTPPSTNKIKKDRKTKGGKVEVVSVEDELFPYDGNKREQYRQKIIDTVNAMIQGTATLDDLLQVVREKKGGKTPIKEDLYDQIRKVYGAPEYYYDDSDEYDGYRYRPDNKSAKLMAKVGELQQKERKEAAKRELGKDTIIEIGKIMGKRENTKNSEGERKTAVRREERHKAPVKENLDKFEEAMSTLEELIAEKGMDGRPDLFDSISRGLTGKSFGHHLRNGAKSLVKHGLKKWSQGRQTPVHCSYRNPMEAPMLLLEDIINEFWPFSKSRPQATGLVDANRQAEQRQFQGDSHSQATGLMDFNKQVVQKGLQGNSSSQPVGLSRLSLTKKGYSTSQPTKPQPSTEDMKAKLQAKVQAKRKAAMHESPSPTSPSPTSAGTETKPSAGTETKPSTEDMKAKMQARMQAKREARMQAKREARMHESPSPGKASPDSPSPKSPSPASAGTKTKPSSEPNKSSKPVIRNMVGGGLAPGSEQHKKYLAGRIDKAKATLDNLRSTPGYSSKRALLQAEAHLKELNDRYNNWYNKGTTN